MDTLENGRRPWRAAGVLLALTTALGAQRTWIVDAGNGPGTDFTDLQSCVDAAADGDTILVRAGRYRAAILAKALTILGITGPGSHPGMDLHVSGLPAGRNCVLKHLGDRLGSGSLRLNSSAGRILVEDFEHQGLSGGLEAIDCAHVMIANLNAFGATARFVGSNVVLTEPTVFTYPGGPGASGGLDLQNSRVWITGGSVAGGNADCQTWFVPTCAISMDQSTLTLSRAHVAAGPDSCRTSGWVPAIRARNSTIRLDAATQVVGTNGPGVSGGTVLVKEVPGMSGAGGPPGGVLSTDLHASAASPFATFASLPANAIDLPPLVWLDPAQAILLDAGAMGIGRRQQSYAVPSTVPLGLPVVVQAVVWAQSAWWSSTPVTLVLAP